VAVPDVDPVERRWTADQFLSCRLNAFLGHPSEVEGHACRLFLDDGVVLFAKRSDLFGQTPKQLGQRRIELGRKSEVKLTAVAADQPDFFRESGKRCEISKTSPGDNRDVGVGLLGQGPHGGNRISVCSSIHRVIDQWSKRAVVVAGHQKRGYSSKVTDSVSQLAQVVGCHVPP
jgi:hypothetical protein